MTRSRARAALYGGLGGALVGLFGLVLMGGRFALGSVVAVPAGSEPTAGAAFMVSFGSFYLAAIMISLLGGLAVAGLAYGFGRVLDPEAPRFPLRYLLPVGAVVATIVGYGLLRAGIGGFGAVDEGMITIGATRMTWIVVVAAAATGMATTDVVDRLARPAVLGLQGAAWPRSGGALAGEMARAVATPLVALIAAAGVAVPLSQALVAAEGTAAVALFSVVGALVLGGAALLAYRPWVRSDGP